MNWLARIPIWLWFLFTFALVYLTWNPTGFSAFTYVAFSDGSWPIRFILAVVLLAIYALYLHETYQTFNIIGAVLFVMLIAGGIWLAIDWKVMNAMSTSAWQWLTPGIIAFLLTIGLQGGRIYRNATGRVPVSVDHHASTDTPTHHQS